MANIKMKTTIIPFLTGCGLALVMLPGQALAQECQTDDDCGDGQICQELSSAGCPEIAILCEEGADCPAPEPCEPETSSYCAQAPCQSDDDCSDNQVCYAYSFEVCEASACSSDEECAQTDAVCEQQESDAYCTAKYDAPCTEDADCGDGFTCDEIESCSCSAGVGVAEGPPASGATTRQSDPEATDTAPVVSEDCSCEPSGEFWCNLIDQECETDDDCAGDLTCTENTSLGSCAVSSDGSSTCDEPETAKKCMPPEWQLAFSGGIAETGAVQTASASSDLASETTATSGGTTTQADGDVLAPTASANTDANGESTDEADMNKAQAESGGGCQLSPAMIGATQPTTWGGLLLALGLLARRRRSA